MLEMLSLIYAQAFPRRSAAYVREVPAQRCAQQAAIACSSKEQISTICNVDEILEVLFNKDTVLKVGAGRTENLQHPNTSLWRMMVTSFARTLLQIIVLACPFC